MKKSAAGLSLIPWLLWVPLEAQTTVPDCTEAPPAQVSDGNGNLLPENRNWDPGSCNPVFPRLPAGAPISAKALAHKPPKGARQEFHRGVEAWHKGRRQEALAHLLEAVRLDPAFVDAQTQLGAVYAQTDQLELALGAFNRALALDTNSAPAHTAKASVLVVLNRGPEAEAEARRALQLDSASVTAHYMLGSALLMQGKDIREAAAQLRIAADTFPRARTLLASIAAK